ncbi:MAG: histidine--tRNA ligase [Chloroflexota bacterium]|nr:histidine--tRNA ligase [Chloroflexota bacterium]NOG63831.1 histidine--tRNA ligase [Chloroflexota bacterium]GIK63941.1 MAG: histidine--tRNA ligase [Chloroflexota bacterium]
MAKLTARTPKGMRDFLPADMIKRQYVFGVIREVFESFGFEPIDTPVLELRENLMSGNYGEDAEKLIYYAQHPGAKEELALRYDLTVPLSRFFAAHENDLSLPFRRYHIAPVWRGDRPQKGRFREFYQCDADIVGVRHMGADAEVMNVVYTVLKRLGFADFTIKYNNRKLLLGIGAYSGVPEDRLPFLYRTIDKTDKIGLEGVAEELRKEGLPEETVQRLVNLLVVEDGDASKRLALLGQLREEMDGIDIAQQGLEELEQLTHSADALGLLGNTAMDFTMVRGLGYYTGPIFETFITKPENLGAVQGGGRYDELIGMFRGQSLPTTGISFGIERILELMDSLNLYPASIGSTVVQALVTLFSDDLQTDALKLAMELREAGIRTETHMDARKGIGKQIGYADSKGIPIVVIAGQDELSAGQVRLKRLADGYEETVGRQELGNAARRLLNLA